MFFSFVIPTYNRASLIGKTIQTLLNQSYQNFEVIVVDDGSTDNSEEVVNAFDPSKVSFHKIPNCERGAARNYGAKISKGDYINFFDSDDLAYPHHLQTALDLIQKHNNPEAFHLHFDIKSPEGNVIRKPFSFTKPVNNLLLNNGNVLSCNGVFLRRDIALQFPFSENRVLSASEDYGLWLRLSSRFNILNSAKVTSSIVQHDMRSVITMNHQKLIARLTTLIAYLKEDAHFVKYAGDKMNKIEAECYSYIALHLAMDKQATEARKWFFKSVRTYFPSLWQWYGRRTFAIVKYSVKNIFG